MHLSNHTYTKESIEEHDSLLPTKIWHKRNKWTPDSSSRWNRPYFDNQHIAYIDYDGHIEIKNRKLARRLMFSSKMGKGSCNTE